MTAGIGHNSKHFDDAQDEPALNEIDIEAAIVVDRAIKVLAAALGKFESTNNVLRRRQGMETLSLRQLAVYCLTHEDPELAIVPLVKLSRIIGFDRGTVRDDRTAVERAAELDETVAEFVEAAREIVVGLPYLIDQTKAFFVGMDIGRCKSRERQRRLLEIKHEMEEALAIASRAEKALKEIGREDLAEHQNSLRTKAPWNPASDKLPTRWRRESAP